ncbi:hypothetical protein AB0O34_06815 [Sphaerisporangium sp. NPDC088356]|uniref:hypothetical protein n=1 Tax=Sphaerisporangium sp. NPDC088356 TaxID=3154871 RepID=UPI00342E47B5
MDEMRLQVDAGPGCTAEQLDRTVGSLYKDLRVLGLFNVKREQVPPPTGAMAGAGYQLGTLVLSGIFSAATMGALGKVLTAYVDRAKARSVEWEFDGHKGLFTALSRDDQHLLVEAVAARIAAAAGDKGVLEEAGAVGSAGAGDEKGGQEPEGGDGGTPDRTAGRD